MIQIENLSFQYKKGKPILDKISTTLLPGHIYGLLGLNGEGKTTLLKLVAGLLFPTQGHIQLDNLPSTSRSKAFLEKLYMLPDQPMTHNFKISEFVHIYSVFYKDFSQAFFEEALHDFKIHPLNNIKSLSLGQQKKFHLAFALAANTKYLLLDEPTNGLDIPSKSVVRKLLAKAISEEKTILISTHLVKDIENLIDHLLISKNGKLVFDMSISAIQRRYTFAQSSNVPEYSLYHEQTLATYRSISTNDADTESNVDIELLFNAVQHDKI
ncbi:MAG TPA: ABC transporter ATP-binding protein [Sphingobacterium sp.]|nr:ABC transporter ATP-binding protein [Sphingobacterium sp.]